MDKIRPAYYITDTDPVDEEVADTSGWYDTEYQNFKADDPNLGWYIAQGWIRVKGVTFEGDVETVTQYKRRVLVPERALASLVLSYTNAYNEGRGLNDQRYDEIVALYEAMLDESEDEAIALHVEDVAHNALIQVLIGGMSTNFNTYEEEVDGLFDDYGDAQRTRIETQFDNQLSTSRASMIARGLYNTTTWDSVSAGIERERALALNDLEDKILERQAALADRIFAVKDNVRGKVVAAYERLRESLHGRDLQRVDLRNRILQALLSFMERREDGYPDMASIGRLAASLGTGAVASQAPS